MLTAKEKKVSSMFGNKRKSKIFWVPMMPLYFYKFTDLKKMEIFSRKPRKKKQEQIYRICENHLINMHMIKIKNQRSSEKKLDRYMRSSLHTGKKEFIPKKTIRYSPIGTV